MARRGKLGSRAARDGPARDDLVDRAEGTGREHRVNDLVVVMVKTIGRRP